MPANEQDWTISLFVPGAMMEAPPEATAEGDGLDQPVEQQLVFSGPQVLKVSGRELQEQWASTVNQVLSLSSAVSDQAKGWAVDEIEVGLTLSAKGELLFIAEGGAEASITLTLKRLS